MQIEEAIQVANNLAPCPFCGSRLHFNAERFRVKGVVPNPSAKCKTEGCFGTSMPVVCMDNPEQVAAWNRREPLSGWQVLPQELTEEMRCEAFHSSSGKLGARSAYRAMLDVAPTYPFAQRADGMPRGFIKPDTSAQVFFYEQDYYVLSNFSAFNLVRHGLTFPTSEHAYHFEKFISGDENLFAIRERILHAPSAHEAFKIAEQCKGQRRDDWDEVKVNTMRDILRAKADQHEYVRRKLLATGDRMLVEDSWRDDFWGWGPNRDGQNMLGKLWMQVRAEIRADATTSAEGAVS